MTTTVKAIYENGKLTLPKPLPLPEKTPVRVTIQTAGAATDSTRAAWLKISEQALLETWDNSSDEVFNDLLKK